jgi:hypothetical protein
MLRRLDVRTAQHRILVSAINWQSLYDLPGRMITLSIVIVDAWNLRLSVVLADLPIGDFFPVVERSPPGRARQPPPPTIKSTMDDPNIGSSSRFAKRPWSSSLFYLAHLKGQDCL